MKKHIAVILGSLFIPPGNGNIRGAFYYTYNFILSLALENDIDIYMPDNIPPDYLPKNENIKYIKCTLPIKAEFLEEKKYDFVWNMSEEKYKNRKFISFDVKHAHTAMYRMKYVRSPLENLLKKIFTPKRCWTREQLELYKYNLALNDILFANSKTAAEDYIKLGGLNENEVCIINPMVILPEKQDLECSKTNNSVFTFGISAVSFALKGGFVFLNALFFLKLKGKKFKAEIIYPKYKKNIFAVLAVFLLGLKKQVKFLDYQKNMKDFYNSIDCLVMPSREETFGLAGLEAASYKIPVIVSNAAGISDIIENGRNGFIFNMRKNPVYNLYKAMFKMMNNADYDKMKNEAYKTAENNTLEKHSRKLNKILDSFLERKKRNEKIFI